VPLGMAVFDQSFQDLRRRQSATPEVEIIIYRNHLGFASSSTGNGSVRFGGRSWRGGEGRTLCSGWRSTIQSLWPSLCYLGIVILFLNRGRWLWLGFLFLVALLPISIRRERERAMKKGAWNGWARVQRAGLILLWGSPIVGFVLTLKAELVCRGWVADWGLAVDVVLLVAMFVLVVGGGLVICVGIVGSWLPEAGTRKRANDSANLE